MLQYGRQARPGDECQDPFPLKASETGLSVPIFLLALEQKGFPLLSLPQYKAPKNYPIHYLFGLVCFFNTKIGIINFKNIIDQ